jgi:6-pyruvoyl-tetrahydropterin synthase
MREWVTDNDMVVDNGDIKSDIIELIEEHLEEGLYNDEDEEGDFENEDEVKRKQQLVISYLSDTLKKFGQDPYASMIENDIVRIDIDRRKFKINGQVYVKISDKENGKFHEGYIFIKDLPTYFTNHKLFEQVNKIKNIINYRK